MKEKQERKGKNKMDGKQRKNREYKTLLPLLPERRSFGGNPLAYFREHYGDRNMTRSQLEREDKSLYNALRRTDQMGSAIPKTILRTPRGYDNLLKYFKDKFGDRKDMTRSQLDKEDHCVYCMLFREKVIDEAIPTKSKKTD